MLKFARTNVIQPDEHTLGLNSSVRCRFRLGEVEGGGELLAGLSGGVSVMLSVYDMCTGEVGGGEVGGVVGVLGANLT